MPPKKPDSRSENSWLQDIEKIDKKDPPKGKKKPDEKKKKKKRIKGKV